MKAILTTLLLAISACCPTAWAQTIKDPAHVDIKVTPFYDSVGPKIEVGAFSPGLASKDEKEFDATIQKMKQSWNKLGFPEMYVAAIRLYDLGYRKESVYWFYSAQYRGRLYGTLLDQAKMGSIGNAGFELLQAQNAFFQLTGPYINGYAFGDLDQLTGIVQRVQKEGRTLPDLKAAYPGVKFKNESGWKTENGQLNDGMTEMLKSLKDERTSIKKQRAEQGLDAKFSKLTSKEL